MKKKTFSRASVLRIFHELECAVGIESYSRVLDVKEKHGFGRDEDPPTKLRKRKI